MGFHRTTTTLSRPQTNIKKKTKHLNPHATTHPSRAAKQDLPLLVVLTLPPLPPRVIVPSCNKHRCRAQQRRGVVTPGTKCPQQIRAGEERGGVRTSKGGRE